MSLSAQLTNPPPAPLHGLPCSIGALRASLPVDEQAALDHMLTEWSQSQVFIALSSEGYEVGRQTIGRHRRRECRCFGARA